MIFGPSWTTLAGGIAVTGALMFPFGAYVGSSHEKNKATAALLKQSEQARAKEANWQQDAATIEEVHADEVRTIARQRDAALLSLRSRPNSVPEASRATAACGTGATLYRDDSEFLVREAARADELRSALGACQSWAAAVTR